jgi:group II intron reverse transcriptase/maturase
VIEGQTGLARVGEKAREEGGKKEKDKEKFTNLFTHLRVDLLTAVYHRLNKSAAAGVDGRTWAEYGQGLHERLVDLQGRLHRGAYHPQPVLRRYIPKADGRMRPLGIPAIEDKIVQGAVVTLLTPIYEAEFRECSFGFRPHRNQHQALEAVDRMMYQGKVDWVLDADIRSFFDKLDQDWLVRMVEHRIGDRRLVRLIRKWLKAGVMEDAKLLATEEGTPQGGLISPLLANIYLHYVLDLWFAKEAKQLSGTAHLVRFADDFIAGFQKQEEVEAFRRRLEQRMREFHLELHPEKTRTLRFGCFAQKDCHKDGIDKPETFDFLGFTHICGKTARGKFRLVRRTSKKKRKAKMADLREKLRRWVYLPLNEQWQRLCSVLRGHYQYYGLSTNFRALHSFARRLRLVWHKQLQRRSQRAHMTRAKLDRLDRLFPLPRPRILGFQRVLCFSP